MHATPLARNPLKTEQNMNEKLVTQAMILARQLMGFVQNPQHLADWLTEECPNGPREKLLQYLMLKEWPSYQADPATGIQKILDVRKKAQEARNEAEKTTYALQRARERGAE